MFFVLFSNVLKFESTQPNKILEPNLNRKLITLGHWFVTKFRGVESSVG